jgi:hypothetical protein
MRLVLCLSIFLANVAAAGGGAGPRGGAAGSPGPPPAVIVRYEFEGDALKSLAIDRDRDGRDDYFAFYQRGRLVRVEIDTDGDGVIDERAVYDHPMQYPFTHVELVEGKHRLLPILNGGYAPGDIAVPRPPLPVRAERLVDGKWQGTFTSKTIGSGDARHEGYAPKVTMTAYKDGKLVSTESEWETGYTRAEYRDGELVRAVAGSSRDRLSQWEYPAADGAGMVFDRDNDGDGKPDERWITPKAPAGAAPAAAPAAAQRRREKRAADGGWTGDYEETSQRASYNGRYGVERTKYEGGSLTLKERTDEQTGRVVAREVWAADGACVSEEDTDFDGVMDLRQTYPGKGHVGNGRVEGRRLLGGKWALDFETPNGARFRGGRQVANFWTDAAGKPVTVWEYPAPDRVVEIIEGKVQKWRWYGADGMPVREERDLDGDERADIVVDYSTGEVRAKAR